MNPLILKHLSKDPILQELISKTPELKPRSAQPSVYEALLRSINFQQLSGKSASAIHGRFLELFPNQYPEPKSIIDTPQEILKSAGLSRQKLGYIQNVAHFFIDKNLMNHDWQKETDETIIKQLTKIKGVGQWTVEMILMFTLKRPDVLPLDDLVVKNGMIELYSVREKGRALNKKLLEIAEPWRAYRTTASRYLWQWKDAVI